MKSSNQMSYHPTAEELVKILQTKTQNNNPLFFRVIVAFYFTMLASQMRVSIKGWTGRGTLPINMYAMALSVSGSGKGHSTTTMEQEVLNNFQAVFERTFALSAESHCEQLAIKRANKNSTDVDDELLKLGKDFQSLGALLPHFSEATTPAIKQIRQKLLMANAGSLNLIIDEIGANFSSSIEPLITYLELFDKGLIKEKLTKSTSESVRFERITGYTPANLLMFGTPTKLLDGAKTEELLFEMLEMGYARRCFFGFSTNNTKNTDMSVDDVIKQLFNDKHDDYLEDLSDRLALLADLSLLNKTITLTDDAIYHLVKYKLTCEKQASELSEFEAIKKSEIEHRYFKVLKLAGAYAFIDNLDEITPTYLDYAISLAEDSGKAFNELLTPQRPYIKLANYLSSIKDEVTLADLDVDLPYYRGSQSQKAEMITMATAWGYKNNIIIKKSYNDGILFLSADSIDQTNTDKMIVSYSQDITQGYTNELVPFEKLPKLFNQDNYHWVNHHLKDGYRKDDNIINGFNLLVLDIDGTANLSTVQLLFSKYKAIYYTTKRHQTIDPDTNENLGDRFRVILPINYTLKLTKDDFKELYSNIVKDLPFEVDLGANQRARKWLTHNGYSHITDGELFDVLPYIPKSAKNDERQKRDLEQTDLDNLERWVINNTGNGNRNNMLLRYATILMDSGLRFESIKEQVISLNNKLPNKLDELELSSTIFQTVANKITQKQ